MAYFEWTPRLSVGIESIDRQHRTLIGFINTLAGALEKGNASMVIGPTVSSLASYTQMHFMYEEMLFDRYGYAEAAGHKTYHARLIKQVEDYKTRFEKGDKQFGPELLEFLKEWLSEHILADDVAYSGFLSQQGVN